jgi:hypothetical protein
MWKKFTFMFAIILITQIGFARGAPLNITTIETSDNRCIVNETFVYFETYPCNALIGQEVFYTVRVASNIAGTLMFGFDSNKTVSLDGFYEVTNYQGHNVSTELNYSRITQSTYYDDNTMQPNRWMRVNLTLVKNKNHTFVARFTGKVDEKVKYWLAVAPRNRHNNPKLAYNNGEMFYQDPSWNPALAVYSDQFTRANSSTVGGNWSEAGSAPNFQILNYELYNAAGSYSAVYTAQNSNVTCMKIQSILPYELEATFKKDDTKNSYLIISNGNQINYYTGSKIPCGSTISNFTGWLCANHNTPYQIWTGTYGNMINQCNVSSTTTAGFWVGGSTIQYFMANSSYVRLDDYCSATNLSNCVQDESPADTTPPTISGLVVDSIGYYSARINYTTNENSNTTIQYGTTTTLGTYLYNSSLSTSKSETLNGLAEGTTYYYNITSCDALANCASNGTNSFTTTNLIIPIYNLSGAPLVINYLSNTINSLLGITPTGEIYRINNLTFNYNVTFNQNICLTGDCRNNWNTFLNTTDQRYNETTIITSQNTTNYAVFQPSYSVTNNSYYTLGDLNIGSGFANASITTGVIRGFSLVANENYCVDQMQIIVTLNNINTLCSYALYNNTNQYTITNGQPYYPDAIIANMSGINYTTSGIKTVTIPTTKINKGQVYHQFFWCVAGSTGQVRTFNSGMIPTIYGLSNTFGGGAWAYTNVGWQVTAAYNGTFPNPFPTGGVLQNWGSAVIGYRARTDISC